MWIPGATLGAPALFLAGSAASLHCGLMCGALSAHHARAAGTMRPAAVLAWVHGGRILGYGLFGAAAGFAGQSLLLHLPGLVGGRVLQALAALCLAGVGASLLLRRDSPEPCCTRQPARFLSHWPLRAALLVRGLLWALVPCGLLYSVLLLAALSGDALSGGLLAAAFACGGTPVLAAVGWSGRRRQSGLRRAAGGWLLALGLAGLAAILLLPAEAVSGWCSLAGGKPW
jgi:sulfite exporter TauE/SafE